LEIRKLEEEKGSNEAKLLNRKMQIQRKQKSLIQQKMYLEDSMNGRQKENPRSASKKRTTKNTNNVDKDSSSNKKKKKTDTSKRNSKKKKAEEQREILDLSSVIDSFSESEMDERREKEIDFGDDEIAEIFDFEFEKALPNPNDKRKMTQPKKPETTSKRDSTISPQLSEEEEPHKDEDIDVICFW
jgi:hypothetical protein